MLENMVKNKQYQVLTKEGYKDFSGINFTEEKTGFVITLENGSQIKCSKKHLIATPYCKLEAKDLRVGTFVEIENEDFSKIVSIKQVRKKFKCYDLTDVQSSDNTYYANNINVSNCAIISTPMWEEFYTATYPVITESQNSKIILVSTPKGKNHFYQIFKEAEQKQNDFIPLKVSWEMVPGRDKAWKETTIKNLGFGGKYKFMQEYEGEFVSAENTLISPDILKDLDYEVGFSTDEIPELKDLDEYKEYVTVYERVIKNHCYSVGFDSAKMTVQNAQDSISIQVFDVTELPFRQVMSVTVRNGLSYLELTKIIAPIIRYYKGVTFIENNGEGQEIANLLYKDYDMADEVFCEKPALTGFRTTVKTKRLGLSFLKTLLENGKIILRNRDTIFQLTSFVKKGVSYGAESGFYDDAVMATVASLFFLQCSDERIENLFENIRIPEKVNFISAVLSNEAFSNSEKREFSSTMPDEDNQFIPGTEAVDISFNFREDMYEEMEKYSDYEEYEQMQEYENMINKNFKNL